MNKEQKQIVLFIALLVVIAGVLVFFNRHRFVPKPGMAVQLPPALPQLIFDEGERDNLFNRGVYKGLDTFAAPVDPWNVGNVGSEVPFRTPKTDEEE
ncbi:MAG: hypothetical protein U9Q03_05015 [Patescibacteria group bacterium]|nr:hypothetical protein [Patescibacteria group bacterium]